MDRHKKPKRRAKWSNRAKDKRNGTYISLLKEKWHEDHKPICGSSFEALEQQLKQIK